jgi:hypothetical protein
VQLQLQVIQIQKHRNYLPSVSNLELVLNESITQQGWELCCLGVEFQDPREQLT